MPPKKKAAKRRSVPKRTRRPHLPAAGKGTRAPYLLSTTSITNYNQPIPSYFQVPQTNANTQITEFTRAFKAELDEALKMYWGVNPDGPAAAAARNFAMSANRQFYDAVRREFGQQPPPPPSRPRPRCPRCPRCTRCTRCTCCTRTQGRGRGRT